MPRHTLSTNRQLTDSTEPTWIVDLHPSVSADRVAHDLVGSVGGRLQFTYSRVRNGFAFAGSVVAAEVLAENPHVKDVTRSR
ncbi:MAG: hypothetical protein M3132_13635 [Actinomycetia bacterium]|nr:hypothetical protein [Actinomycetes bacterium]